MEDWSARVAEGPGLRRTLEAARRWGVRPSVFLGEAEVTTYDYNTAGQVVRATQAGWTADDRALALALEEYEAGLCSGCHAPLSETATPEAEDMYEAGLAIRCHRCTATARASEFYRESPQPSALMVPVHRRNTT